MTRFCPFVFGFRNKEKSGSQPACLDHMQDRRALALKAHQSESHLPIGRLGSFGEDGGGWPQLPSGSCPASSNDRVSKCPKATGKVLAELWL
jgi:hypothetical protein